MTLAECVNRHQLHATTLPSGCVVVASNVPDLWYLSDYVVSSVVAGSVYLVPRS